MGNLNEIIKGNLKGIVELSVRNVSDESDSVVYMDKDTGELYNNPDNVSNNLVEVYRLEKGFVCEKYISVDCIECDHLYTCDNMYEMNGEQIFECTVNKLVADFNL